MRYLQLSIRFPPERRHPMQAFLVEGDSVRRAYLRHWNYSDPDYVVSLFQVVGETEEARADYVAALDSVDTVVDYDVTPIDRRRFYVYLTETTSEHARRFRALLADTDLLVVPPIEYGTDGEMTLEVAGDSENLQALVAGLPDELSVSVDRLGEYDTTAESSTAVLTDRQQEVVSVARELGYYEVPREASVRDIAARLDSTKSTVADHLRKAESRLVAAYGSSERPQS